MTLITCINISIFLENQRIILVPELKKRRINTPICKKLFGMMPPFNTGINLFCSKNINNDSFQTFIKFKMYIKDLD